jgi:two-component system cell cycle response regulator
MAVVMNYNVALCGLSDHRAHLLQVVVAAPPAPKYGFTLAKPERLDRVDIAIVETSSNEGQRILQGIRAAANSEVVAIFVSDLGDVGDSAFRIARSSLMLRIKRLLEEVVDGTVLGKSLRLPPQGARAAVAPAEAAVEAPPDERFRSSSRPMALVVDDSAAIRAEARAALLRAGFDACEAESAEQALELLSRSRFDIALFDVVMPGIDGYELCRRVKRDPATRAMPVLMLTSRSSPFDRARGALVGCQAYLVKPIDWRDLVAAVDKAIGRNLKDAHGLRARGLANIG